MYQMVVQPTAPSLKEILQTQLLVLESFHVVLTFNPTIFLFSPFFGLCVISLQIFVGGLDPNVTDEDLRTPFSEYGDIVSVKIPVGKGCGFVQFANRYYSGYRFCDNSVAHIKFDPHSSYVSVSFTLGRNNAEEALQKLTGTTIGKQTVRLSWGRNPANKQVFVLSSCLLFFPIRACVLSGFFPRNRTSKQSLLFNIYLDTTDSWNVKICRESSDYMEKLM